MRIDDVLVLFPELRPQSRVLERFSRNSRQSLALFYDMDFEVVRIGRILIRAHVPIRPNRQILGRRPLLRTRFDWSFRRYLREYGRTHQQRGKESPHKSAITSRCASDGQLNVEEAHKKGFAKKGCLAKKGQGLPKKSIARLRLDGC